MPSSTAITIWLGLTLLQSWVGLLAFVAVEEQQGHHAQQAAHRDAGRRATKLCSCTQWN